MARASSTILDSGEALPSLELNTVAHGQTKIPDAFRDRWGVFLLYRAHW